MFQKKEGSGGGAQIALRVGLSAAIGLALLLVLLTAAAVLINRDLLRPEHVTLASLAALFLAAAVAGFLGAGEVRRLPHALLTAALLFLLLLLLGVVSWGPPSPVSLLRSAGVVLLGGVVGGVLSSLRH